jgi:hypothetical protein
VTPVEASAHEPSLERDWWLRTVLVLQAPRAVFLALRDESGGAAAARAEPVLLIVWLAGMVSVLSTATAGRLMDDHDYDGLLVCVWTFLAGGLYGGVAYFLFGAALYGGVKALGSDGSYRRARHLLAFAAVPLALSLVLWPLRIALYGADLFHRGGADTGAGGTLLALLSGAFGLWSLALLALGVRAVHGWTWARSAAAIGAGVVLPLLLLLALSSL